MFIKPGVYKYNAKAWAEFDKHQSQQRKIYQQLGGNEAAEWSDSEDGDNNLWSESDAEDSNTSSSTAETVEQDTAAAGGN